MKDRTLPVGEINGHKKWLDGDKGKSKRYDRKIRNSFIVRLIKSETQADVKM